MDRADILKLLRERIVRFAASRLKGDMAEDLAQDVLLVIHQKYPALDRVEDLVPLALEITRLKLWAFVRKTHRRGEDRQVAVEEHTLTDSEPSPLEQAELGERVRALEAAMSTLGSRCRELFRLKLEGYTFPEICKQMGASSLNTLYTWDLRCRKQLRQRLEADLSEERNSR